MALIPLLYLPNFTSGNTGFGELETADFLMIPLIFLILIDPTRRKRYVYARFVIRPAIAFIISAMLATLFIFFFYDYKDPMKPFLFSTLKIAKFCLYASVPLFVASKLEGKVKLQDYHWMLLFCLAVCGVGVIMAADSTKYIRQIGSDASYKALNLVSNVFAMLVTYHAALLIVGYGTPVWRAICKWVLIISLIGYSLTQGRGGWLAGIVAFIYFGFQMGLLRVRTLVGLIAGVVVVLGIYFNNSDFRRQVDVTITPDDSGMVDHELGIDEGYRLLTWSIEAKKVFKAPFFGTGFYHRGGETGLFRSGSHNFWLQMFLETGFIGGFLILFTFMRMWAHGNSGPAVQAKLSLPLKTSLLAGFIGGMSGEYFYGGLGLLTILLIYAPVGGLIIADKKAQHLDSDPEEPLERKLTAVAN